MKQPRLHVRRSIGLGILAAGLSGCSFSDSGIGVDPAPQAPPASDRPDRGGSGGSSGAGGAGPVPPVDPGTSAPMPAPAADAGGADSAAPAPPPDAGSSGITSVRDSAAPPSPPTPEPPAPDPEPPLSAKDQCPTGESALALCLRFEEEIRDESRQALSISVERVGFDSGPTGSALALGDSSVVKVANHADLNQSRFSIEAWVRVSRLPANGQRMGIIDNEGRYGLFVLPGGTLACYAGSGTAQVSDAIEAGSWTSVGCVSDGATLSVWVEGIRRAQGSYTAPAVAPPSLGVTIGSNNPSGDNLVGLVDNVRIWSAPRSERELCAAALGCD